MPPSIQLELAQFLQQHLTHWHAACAQACNLAALWLHACSCTPASLQPTLPELLLGHALSQRFVGPMDVALLPLTILQDAAQHAALATELGLQLLQRQAMSGLLGKLVSGLSLQVCCFTCFAFMELVPFCSLTAYGPCGMILRQGCAGHPL